MSRYLLDKFLYQVDRDPAFLESYIDDPAVFLDWWEAERAQRLTEVESVRVHAFSDEERTAIAEMDVRAMYLLGAHPFILWTLMFPILERSQGSIPAAIEHYKRLLEGAGTVDFRT